VRSIGSGRDQTTKLSLFLEVELPGYSEGAHLTLASLRLPDEATWDRPIRERINRLSGKQKGRVLFCIVDDRIVAAIGFTVQFQPLVAYALALDAGQPLGLRALRRTKQCLHYLALALGRPGALYLDAPPATMAMAKTLGFRPAGKAYDIRASATLLVQDPS
jgi:hypothetical protein